MESISTFFFYQKFVCISLSDSVQIFFLFIVSVLPHVVPSSVSLTIEVLRLFMLIEQRDCGVCVCVCVNSSVMSDFLRPHGL